MTDDIRVLKTGTCPSLSGKSKLTFEIGCDAAARISVRITKNTGGGLFNKDWVALDRVPQLVGDKPITSGTLAPLFKGGSANSAGFLLAVMKHEGLVQNMADKPRCYERLDGKAFFAEIKALMRAETTPKTPRPAVYVSEVHGPVVPAPKAKKSAKR